MKPLVSEEEYLTKDYSPDVDYVDGRIEERNRAEKDHGKLQLKFANLVNSLSNVHAFIETRVKVRDRRYRVPDVCVFVDHEPSEQVFTEPPFLCVEILSPEDRMSRVMGGGSGLSANGRAQRLDSGPLEPAGIHRRRRGIARNDRPDRDSRRARCFPIG